VIGVIRPDSPGVLAAVQAADVEPSTTRRGLIELAKQIADAVEE